jgi:hypothetical protein
VGRPVRHRESCRPARCGASAATSRVGEQHAPWRAVSAASTPTGPARKRGTVGGPTGSAAGGQQTLPTHGHLLTQHAHSGRQDSLTGAVYDRHFGPRQAAAPRAFPGTRSGTPEPLTSPPSRRSERTDSSKGRRVAGLEAWQDRHRVVGKRRGDVDADDVRVPSNSGSLTGAACTGFPLRSTSGRSSLRSTARILWSWAAQS